MTKIRVLLTNQKGFIAEISSYRDFQHGDEAPLRNYNALIFGFVSPDIRAGYQKADGHLQYVERRWNGGGCDANQVLWDDFDTYSL